MTMDANWWHMKVSWWHNLVARDLVWFMGQQSKLIERYKAEILSQDAMQLSLVKANGEIIKELNETKRQLAEEIATRKAGVIGCVLSSHDHAAKQRIRDLEDEVLRLSKRKS